MTNSPDFDGISKPKPGSELALSVPWKRVGVAGGLFGIACLTALAVIVSTEHVNLLASIALALAILSFSAQLMIFTVQTWTSTQQLRESQELNSETRELVSSLRAEVGGTRELVTGHFHELLEAAVGKSLPSLEKVALDPTLEDNPALRSTVLRLREALGALEESEADGKGRASTRQSRGHAHRSVEWPREEDVEGDLAIFRSLSNVGRWALGYAALSELLSGEGEEGYNPVTEADRELADKGIAQIVTDKDGDETVVLTSSGKRLGDLFLVAGEPPEWVKNLGIEERLRRWKNIQEVG